MMDNHYKQAFFENCPFLRINFYKGQQSANMALPKKINLLMYPSNSNAEVLLLCWIQYLLICSVVKLLHFTRLIGRQQCLLGLVWQCFLKCILTKSGT